MKAVPAGKPCHKNIDIRISLILPITIATKWTLKLELSTLSKESTNPTLYWFCEMAGSPAC